MKYSVSEHSSALDSWHFLQNYWLDVHIKVNFIWTWEQNSALDSAASLFLIFKLIIEHNV